MKKKKFNIWKIIFCLSFLPYLCLLLVGIFSSIFGYKDCSFLGYGCNTLYGFKAFRSIILWHFLALTFTGVIPILGIYDVVYIIYNIIRKNIKYLDILKWSYFIYVILFLCVLVLGFDIIGSLPFILILGFFIIFHVINLCYFFKNRN